MDVRRAGEVMRYWLAPWAVGSRSKGFVGIMAESPAMRTHSLHGVLSGPEPLVAIPVLRRASFSFPHETIADSDSRCITANFPGKRRLSPIPDKEDLSSGDEDHNDIDMNGGSFATHSSFTDSLAEDSSFATTSTSLTSIGTVADPGNFIHSSLVTSVFSLDIDYPSFLFPIAPLLLLNFALNISSF